MGVFDWLNRGFSWVANKVSRPKRTWVIDVIESDKKPPKVPRDKGKRRQVTRRRKD